MNSLQANTRNTKSKGDVRSLRLAGNIPGIVYGGTEQNQKVTVLKKTLKILIAKKNFLSNIITLELDGKPQNVLPREITYNVVSDEPTHIDFLRIVPGVKIRIEVPVQFINHETSPGLKRGGVLNIVRRKIELKCPSEKSQKQLQLILMELKLGKVLKYHQLN
jgi:large subunit ribosomal protein L25